MLDVNEDCVFYSLCRIVAYGIWSFRFRISRISVLILSKESKRVLNCSTSFDSHCQLHFSVILRIISLILLCMLLFPFWLSMKGTRSLSICCVVFWETFHLVFFSEKINESITRSSIWRLFTIFQEIYFSREMIEWNSNQVNYFRRWWRGMTLSTTKAKRLMSKITESMWRSLHCSKLN